MMTERQDSYKTLDQSSQAESVSSLYFH